MVKAFSCSVLLLMLTPTSSAQVTKPTPAVAPQWVCLNEILVPASESDTQAQIAEAKSKAEQIRNAVRLGAAFADLARANSQGPSALDGGALGCFSRGQLTTTVEDQAFGMKAGDVSDVIRTKQGFVILKVAANEQDALSTSQQTTLNAHASGVKGIVVDAFHVPIRDAYVLVHRDSGADIHAHTDENGRYAIPLTLGIYDVFMSAKEFSPTSRKIEVTPEGMMIYDAVLEVNILGMNVD